MIGRNVEPIDHQLDSLKYFNSSNLIYPISDLNDLLLTNVQDLIKFFFRFDRDTERSSRQFDGLKINIYYQ